MRITDVRAHHIRIPYDAGVASFKQGASAIAALDIVLVEVSTDAGLTGWGDAFGYVCPRSTATAIDEMIAPQARGLEVPDAAGIPAFMERIQRNLHLFGRYGITMFAISGLDIALWDLAARAKGEPLHRLLGGAKRARIPAYASLLRIGDPALVAQECETALRRGYPAIKLHETTVPAVVAARQAIGTGIPLMVDMNCPDGWRRRDRIRAGLPRGRADVSGGAGVAAGGFRDPGAGARQGRARRCGRRECLHGASVPADADARAPSATRSRRSSRSAGSRNISRSSRWPTRWA